MLVVCMVGPITYAIVMIKKFADLATIKVRYVWGAIYKEIRVDQTKIVVLQVEHFYIRRLLLIIVVVV